MNDYLQEIGQLRPVSIIAISYYCVLLVCNIIRWQCARVTSLEVCVRHARSGQVTE